jgi:hypothetical protein
METVNQSLMAIVVTSLLGGCIAAQPVAGDTANSTDQTAARLIIAAEQQPWDDLDLFAYSPRFAEPNGART